MSREVISKTGAHFRISASDPTVLEIQRGHGHRWRAYATCPDAERARAWLSILGDLRTEAQEDMTQEEAESG